MALHKRFTVLFLCFYSISAHSLSPALPDESFIRIFDKDGDYKLNLKEFLVVKKSSAENLDWDFPVTQSSFKTLDRNKNGFLDIKDKLPIYYSKEFSEYALCLSNREQK